MAVANAEGKSRIVSTSEFPFIGIAVAPDGKTAAVTLVKGDIDIWALDIAEGSEPELFLPSADSPAVIRGDLEEG